LEFAQMYRRFGSEVTIVERGRRLCEREDEDVSENVNTILEDEGIKIRLGAECIGFEKRDDKVAVQVDCSSGDKVVIGSHTLLAVGRVPNTNDFGLENAGIEMNERGYIQVDDHLRTNVPGVYALGDCNGRGAFTHTAYNDYEIVAANFLDGDHRRVSDRIPAYALYIDPPLGRAGMTEAEVRKSGRQALIAKRPMTQVGRAREKGETGGFRLSFGAARTYNSVVAARLWPECVDVIQPVLGVMCGDVPCTMIPRLMAIDPFVTAITASTSGAVMSVQKSTPITKRD